MAYLEGDNDLAGLLFRVDSVCASIRSKLLDSTTSGDMCIKRAVTAYTRLSQCEMLLGEVHDAVLGEVDRNQSGATCGEKAT